MATVTDLYYSTAAPGFELKVDSLTIPEEGITCIWGPSGSGKSTLLEILAGLHPKNPKHLKYKFTLGGEPIDELKPEARHFGFVFQDYGLFPHMTVDGNIDFALEALKKKTPESLRFKEQLLEKLNLCEIRHRKAALISGGEAQRTALARALVTRPRLVLLDEPLSALDEDLKTQARALIRQLCNETRIPFLLVTHDRRDVEILANYVVVLNAGRVAAQGTQTHVQL
jgi:sulfate transport system ATP-binding protein/putative spermidine/putrescine transport system ATP-binding protein